MDRTIKPLNDRILVRRTEAKSVTPGGILIPDTAKLKSVWGEILAVGPGRFLKKSLKRRPMHPALKPGVVVRFPGNRGQEIAFEEEQGLVMLMEGDVAAVREE